MLEHHGMSLSEQTLCWFMSWHTNHEYQQGLYLSAGSQGSYYGYTHAWDYKLHIQIMS